MVLHYVGLRFFSFCFLFFDRLCVQTLYLSNNRLDNKKIDFFQHLFSVLGRSVSLLLSSKTALTTSSSKLSDLSIFED